MTLTVSELIQWLSQVDPDATVELCVSDRDGQQWYQQLSTYDLSIERPVVTGKTTDVVVLNGTSK